MRVKRIPFALLLPLVELSVWSMLVLVPTYQLYSRVGKRLRGDGQVELYFGQASATIRKDRVFSFLIGLVATQHSHFLSAANLPGIVFDLLLPNSWHSADLPLDAWRAVALPFCCLPAWWFAGRGLDGLLTRRNLHWASLFIGSALTLLFLVGLIAYPFQPQPDRADLAWIMWGVGFWTIAFGIFPAAWIRQALTSRREKARTTQS
jgi:hypothetical protein